MDMPPIKSLIDPAGRRGPSKLAFCWSHARRNFYDLAKDGAAPIATEALQQIARLYQIEADIRGLSAPERRAARQARSHPLLEELRSWFVTQRAKLPGSAPTAEAIGYALNHWDGLVQFLDDGRIEIDSNCVERSMRPVALSRKNSLFAGSRRGRRELGRGGVADRDLQAECRQSAVLFYRSADPARQRLAPSSHRPTHALVLGHLQSHLIVKTEASGPRSSAYAYGGPESVRRARVVIWALFVSLGCREKACPVPPLTLEQKRLANRRCTDDLIPMRRGFLMTVPDDCFPLPLPCDAPRSATPHTDGGRKTG